MKNQEIKAPLSEPIAFVSTSNLHLATLLATVGAQPQQIIQDGGVTPEGNPLTRWVFKADGLAEETIAFWNNPGKYRNGRDVLPIRDWEQMTHEERSMAINVVAAFTSNLKHFVKHVHARRSK